MRIGDNNEFVELLQDKETGKFYEPYATFYCKAKEDLEKLQRVLEKQTVKELRVWANGTEHCSNCDHDLSQRDYDDTHCPRCGQRYKEEQRVNKGDNIDD